MPNIKTVAILPFDNETPEPALTTEVATAVHQAIEDRLGLRPSGEQSADAQSMRIESGGARRSVPRPPPLRRSSR